MSISLSNNSSITNRVAKKIPASQKRPEPPRAQTQFPALPAYKEKLAHIPFLDGTNQSGSLNEFIMRERTFVIEMTPDKRRKLCDWIKKDPHRETFMNEPFMAAGFTGDIEIKSNYGAVIDACSKGLKSYFRGGLVRSIFDDWFAECSKLIGSNPKSKASNELIPDVDLVIKAPDMSIDEILQRENLIFRHLAECMSKTKPELLNCYYVLVSLFCCSKRETISKGGLYTLTTLRCKNSPDLEVIICNHFEREALFELDNIGLDYKTQTLHCNLGENSETALWQVVLDNAEYTLTATEPESIDGLGLARLLSHTVRGATIKGKDTHRKIYDANHVRAQQRSENFVSSLCVQMQKCADNHLKSCSKSLAAMYWNLYVLQGCKEPQFFHKAREKSGNLEFQKKTIPDLQKWVLQELSKSHSTASIEWVQNEDVDWIQVHQNGVFWLLPSFTLADAELVQLLRHSRKKVPAAIIRENFSHVEMFDQPLPLALILQEKVKWHSLALKEFKALNRSEQQAMAEEMIVRGNVRSLDYLFKIYHDFPSPYLFFVLVEKTRMFSHNNNASLQVDHLCELALKLPPMKAEKPEKGKKQRAPQNYTLLCEWMIEKCHSVDHALRLYQSLTLNKYLAPNPAKIIARVNFSTMNAIELVEHPLIAELGPAVRLQHLTRALSNDPYHAPDSLFHRCVVEGLIDTQAARALFERLIPLFSFTVLDWVLELFPANHPMSIETYTRLPPQAQVGMGYRSTLSAAQFIQLLKANSGEVLTLHEILLKHLVCVNENFRQVFYHLLAITLRLIANNLHKEASYWVPFLLRNVLKIPKEKRILLLNWCIEQSHVNWAYELALTLKQVSPSQTDFFIRSDELSLENKCALLRLFNIDKPQFWQALVSVHAHDQQMPPQLIEGVKAGLISRKCARALLAPVLAESLHGSANSSETMFETSVRIMTQFPEMPSLEDRRALLAGCANYFLKAKNGVSVVDSCFRLLKRNTEFLQKFIFTLAAINQSTPMHAKSLEYLIKNSDKEFYAGTSLNILGLATLWRAQETHAEALTAIARTLVSNLRNAPEGNPSSVITLLQFLIHIKSPAINELCGSVILEYNSTISRKDFDTWGAIIEHWLGDKLTLHSNHGLDLSEWALLHGILFHDLFKDPILNKYKVRIAKRLCAFVKAHLPVHHTNTSYASVTIAVDFVIASAHAIRKSPKDLGEIAPLVTELVAKMLAPGRLFDSFLERFGEIWKHLLTLELAPGVPSKAAVFDSLQAAREGLKELQDKVGSENLNFGAKTLSGRVVAVTRGCRERRFSEVKSKALLLCQITERFCLSGLAYKAVLCTFDQLLDNLMGEFPDQDKILLSVIHRYAFAITPTNEPAFTALHREHASTFISRAYFFIKFVEAPLETFEIYFHFNNQFVDSFSPEKNTACAKKLVLRCMDSNHPSWVWDGVCHLPALEKRMSESEYVAYTGKVYTAAGKALGKIGYPYSYQEFLLIEQLYHCFVHKSALCKSKNEPRGMKALRNETAQALIEGGIAHLELCTEEAACIKIYEQLTILIDKHYHKSNPIELTAWFNYYRRIIFALVKRPLKVSMIGRIISRFNFDAKVKLSPAIKSVRLEILRQLVAALPTGIEGESARQTFVRFTTVSFDWFTDVPNGEELKNSIFTAPPSPPAMTVTQALQASKTAIGTIPVIRVSQHAVDGTIFVGQNMQETLGIEQLFSHIANQGRLQICEVFTPEDYLANLSFDVLAQSDSACDEKQDAEAQ